jgi:hypothetical protein
MLQAATGVLTGSQRPTQQKQDLANSANEFKYSEVNFNHLIYEITKLRQERVEVKEKLLKKNEVIEIQKEFILNLCKSQKVDKPLMFVQKGAM